ncbi:MAG: Zn-dependent hydrolase [Desulfovibrionaceae bacterium]|nr:MAG: Zn-dependent hydrolase [Desulfovibrionaceae bacterium]
MTKNRYEAARAALEPSVLLEQLRDMGDIGLTRPGDRDSGRTRMALDDGDRDGRDRLTAWMRELDLDVRVDGIGNIFGLLPGAADLPPLMMGSHIDTVAQAGPLDGVYGVLSGLAVVRAFRKAGVVPPRPLAVAAFTNEEGVRFQPDMLGSLVHVGGLSLDAALNARGIDGARLGDELVRIGYAGSAPTGALRPAAYLELHVEQGPVLEAEGFQIGVVEGVQGISWRRISVEGQSNHAGTTPTRLRRDAGLTAARIVTRLREMTETGETVATVGRLHLEPDLVNVIPARATLTVDMRDPDEQRLRAAEDALDAYLLAVAAQDGVRVSSERLARFEPVPFDPALVNVVEDTARRLGYSCRRMVSGAGHDAQMMARICPTAMIFTPSKGGLSHCPQECTDPEDLSRGVAVLMETVLVRLAGDEAR